MFFENSTGFLGGAVAASLEGAADLVVAADLVAAVFEAVFGAAAGFVPAFFSEGVFAGVLETGLEVDLEADVAAGLEAVFGEVFCVVFEDGTAGFVAAVFLTAASFGSSSSGFFFNSNVFFKNALTPFFSPIFSLFRNQSDQNKSK